MLLNFLTVHYFLEVGTAATFCLFLQLRLMYECIPMAFIIEQAGGVATDGENEILALKVDELEQRCPIYIGSRFEVEKAMEFLSQHP